MKHQDPDPLLNELLAGSELDGFREESLQVGLAALRRARRRRQVWRRSALVMLPLVTALLLWSFWPAAENAGVAVTLASGDSAEPSPRQATADRPVIEVIDDAELFSLFPGRSLALVGSPGQQRLIFLDDPVAN